MSTKFILTMSEEYVKFDVMCNDRYICTMRYKPRTFVFDVKEIEEYVISKLPTLKGKDFNIALYDIPKQEERSERYEQQRNKFRFGRDKRFTPKNKG